MTFVNWDDIPANEVLPGIRLRTPYGEKIMLSMLEMDPGTEVPLHNHPHEQAGLLLEGTMELTIGEEVRICKPGDAFIIPGGVKHRARALTAVKNLDIFSPPREDYAALQSRYFGPGAKKK